MSGRSEGLPALDGCGRALTSSEPAGPGRPVASTSRRCGLGATTSPWSSSVGRATRRSWPTTRCRRRCCSVEGPWGAIASPSVAIVGTRHATVGGMEVAAALGRGPRGGRGRRGVGPGRGHRRGGPPGRAVRRGRRRHRSPSSAAGSTSSTRAATSGLWEAIAERGLLLQRGAARHAARRPPLPGPQPHPRRAGRRGRRGGVAGPGRFVAHGLGGAAAGRARHGRARLACAARRPRGPTSSSSTALRRRSMRSTCSWRWGSRPVRPAGDGGIGGRRPSRATARCWSSSARTP